MRKIIAEIRKANVEEDDWLIDILNKIEDPYIRGYAKGWFCTWTTHTDEFLRDEMITLLGHLKEGEKQY
jgi:hypothetical protein